MIDPQNLAISPKLAIQSRGRVSQPISGLPDIAPSAARYLLAAVPVFLLLGRWSVRRSWLEQLLIAGGFMLQGVLVTFFLSNGWVG